MIATPGRMDKWLMVQLAGKCLLKTGRYEAWGLKAHCDVED
jgi:hypothetical protein